MAVEEIFVPVRAILRVGCLGVKTHDCREELGQEKDYEASHEGCIGGDVGRSVLTLDVGNLSAL